MKRSIILMIVILSNLLVFSNSNFDKTLNYQFNNPHAYIGEVLYLVPHTGSGLINIFGDSYEHYHNFLDFYEFQDDAGSSKIFDHYKYNLYDERDNKASGTHKRHIEGHKFRVDKVVSLQYYDWMWVLYLTDLNTGDKLKYLYNGAGRDQVDFEVFPFIVEKYYNYLKSLIGTKLIFATKTPNIYINELTYFNKYYPTFEEDIITGEKINYTSLYVKWTITDVGIDVYYSSPYFIVTNGKYTTKIIYNNPYYNIDNFKTYHPFCTVNRVFTEKQWKELVNIYNESYMLMVMNTNANDFMTDKLKYMSGGRQYGKYGKYKNISNSSNNKITNKINETKKFVTNSTSETYKSTKSFIKDIINRW